jgi:CO/xanthine dehydrogenase FAD-binding subunit
MRPFTYERVDSVQAAVKAQPVPSGEVASVHGPGQYLAGGTTTGARVRQLPIRLEKLLTV